MKAANQAYKVVILTSSTSEVDIQQREKYTNVIDFCSKPLTRELAERLLQTSPIPA